MTSNKKELRNLIRQRKRQFSESKLQELSFAITAKLLSHPRIVNARVVMAYCALNDEVNTSRLIDELKEMGKQIVLPAVISNTEMEARLYRGVQDLAIGAYGISEPIGNKYEHIEDIDVVIVPGMAFDDDGHRLGRGKGYYDRFLSMIPNSYKIGVCFSFQKLSCVPTDAHDVATDDVVTD